MNNRSSDGREVQGGRQAASAQERTQCECPKKFAEKWKTSQVYELVIYRWNEYIFKLRKVLGLWPGGRTLAAALTLTFICTLTAHGKFKPSVLKHFPTVVFFLSLSPGHNPECGPDKVTFVHRASDSLCLRLPGCLGACFLLGPLMRSVKPGCPFQPFVLATQFAPRRRISCQFKSQTKCLSPTWLWVCMRVCVNFLIES